MKAIHPIKMNRGLFNIANLFSTIGISPFLDLVFADLLSRPTGNPVFKPLRKKIKERYLNF